ncbi:hypothetical protein RKE29_24950 [Streptomyces sp. B1866]|uniref:hypothetical protein n=1 Tax=Streptomyces sp. B1866 TaxID=3075431 RepID=UPI0028924F5D|nr:hypothetical protein [Streptomyces sp. B1866]MDT3399846.1 hypothetical protein [Streptomyces sp. B1866]
MSRAGRRGPRAELLAGWLFADLLIVLVLVVLGGQQAPVRPQTPAGAARSSVPPSPGPSRTGAGPPGLDRTPVVIEVLGDAGDQRILGADRAARDRARRSLVAAVRAAVAAQKQKARDRHEVVLADRRAAVCSVFGTYRTGSGVGSEQSKRYAEAVSRLMHEAVPAVFPADPVFYEQYHDLGAPAGHLTVKVFVFADPR